MHALQRTTASPLPGGAFVRYPRLMPTDIVAIQDTGTLLAGPDESRQEWYEAQLDHLSEVITELQLRQEDVGWLRLNGGDFEIGRQDLRNITSICRTYALRHPLINRALNVQTYYVMGQGLSFRAKDSRVQELLTSFWEDAKNAAELSKHVALTGKEEMLSTTGNLFLTLFANLSTGKVRVRSIPFAQVEEIYFNPDDGKDPWFYRRSWTERRLTLTAAAVPVARTAWYPDWRYNGEVPARLGGFEVIDTRVMHIKVGALDDMPFGLSEFYQAIDWAKAYQVFLTDWAALVKALNAFAWKVTVKGGIAARQSAKEVMSRDPSDPSIPNRTSEPAGAKFIATEGQADISAIPKTGATISAEDARRLLLMVAAATGLPETFFGDASVGTLATATSLDRPTELKFRNRQQLWTDVLGDLFGWVIDRAIEAPNGPLDGTFEQEEGEDDGIGKWVLAPPEPLPGEEPVDAGDRTVDVTFPPILEHDVAASVTAAVSAITLNGSPISDTTITAEQAARLILTALGVDDIDSWIDEIFPRDPKTGEPILRADQQRREELQTQADAAKNAALGLPGPGSPPPANPGGNQNPPPAPNANATNEALHEAVTALITWLESNAKDAA